MGDSSQTDSFTLLRQHRAGVPGALDRLLARHYPRVERIVRVRLGPALVGRVEVADVVQECMLQAARRVERFEQREDARIIHWLARLAETEIRRQLKYHRAEKRNAWWEASAEETLGGDEEAPQLEVTGDQSSVAERAVRREEGELVERCLQTLPERYREVILLRQYAGASWDFVRDQMGAGSKGAVQKLYERALRALRCEVARFL